MGPRSDDSQPQALRIFGARRPATFRFAVVADHQLWDPGYRVGARELDAGAGPRRDKEAANLVIARHGLAELALLGPDFVVHGDLTLGLDDRREYAGARELLREPRLPILAVPGNHDGCAEHSVSGPGSAS